MPKQDWVTSWQRHEAAVNEVAAALKDAGIREHLGSHFLIPPYHFTRAPLRSVVPRHGVMPRDLVMRLAGEPFSVKVFATNGQAHSSLFRAVAYSVLAREDEAYLQVVLGGPPTPIKWLADLQGPINLANPGGIHGIRPFIAAVKAAVPTHPQTKPEENANELD